MFLIDSSADGIQPRHFPGAAGRGEAEQRHVFILHGDLSAGACLRELLAARGYGTAVFGSAAAYLEHARPQAPACLVLDRDLPDMSGLDLQLRISVDTHPPVVFATAQGDVASSVRAMKQGAVDYLAGPVDGDRLLAAVAEAIARDRSRRAERAALVQLEQRYSSLSPRERQVLPLVVGGLLNKQASAELGIAEITLKSHRGKLMRKMGAESLPELVRMAGRLNVPPTTARRRGYGTARP